MTESLPEPPQLDPAALAATTFSRGRKGFDPVEVNTAMGRAADALRTWELRDRQLTARIEALEAKLNESREMDEGRIASVLGEETARIITTAREAAGEIRTKAEEDAARLLKETEEAATAKARGLEDEAQHLRDQAQELHDNAAKDAERAIAEAGESAAAIVEAAEKRRDDMVAAAATILEERTTEAEAAAAAMTAEGADKLAQAESEAQTLRDDAKRDAEGTVEAARIEGREMVNEAKAVRERILVDLADRRRIARQQIEAARSGRDSIVELLRNAGAELSATADGLVDSDDETNRSALEAVESLEDDTDAFLAELDVELGVDHFELIEVEPASEPVSILPEPTVNEPTVDESNVVEIFGDPQATVDEDQAEDQTHDKAEDKAETEIAEEDDSEDEIAEEVVEAAATIDITVEPEEPVLVDTGGATVHDLFARIRAEGVDSGESEGGSSSEEPSIAPEIAESAEARATAVATTTGTATATIALDDMTAVLDRRDSVLIPIEKQLLRSLRRLASDEQNETLDRLRRVKRGRPEMDAVLASVDESTDRFVLVLLDDFSDAVEAGVSFWAQLSGASADALFDDSERSKERLHSMVADFITVHRAHLEMAFSDAEEAGLDTAELGDSLSASYRDWRSNSLSELAGDLATAGFAHGERTAAGPGTPWRWVVDNGGLPCADGEDNALAGAIACEEPFPTGDITPPAHSGCRCLLVPARQ